MAIFFVVKIFLDALQIMKVTVKPYFENRFPLVYGTIRLPKSDVYVSFIIILTIPKFCEPLMQNISKKTT